jgi:aldehyde dehydrogenase (NAD+)
MKRFKLWIGGRAVDPINNQWLDSIDPFTGDAWASIPRANEVDVSLAVAAANEAMKGEWGEMSASERGRVMRQIGDVIAKNAQSLCETEVRDNGKLLSEMLSQIRYISEYWHYFAGLADKIEGSVVPLDRKSLFGFTRQVPVGVVAALTAWNSPLMFFTIKCAPALAAGCSVVVKPSEFASVSSLLLAPLTTEAGLPDGVINVVSGLGAEVGGPLVNHPDVAMVSFTGSDVTGLKVYEAAARGMKRVHLELGGKSPNIVFADADIERAVAGATTGIFGSAGQMCTAGSRVLVQNSVKEAFIERLVDVAGKLVVGNPFDLQTDMGPIATKLQYQKVLDYIDIAKSEGAICVLGGGPAFVEGAGAGQFVAPTIFTGVSNNMRIAQEEVFGPVLSVIGFGEEEDAIRIGNEIAFGLAAGVWTADIGRGLRMADALKAGTVWVNTYRSYSYMLPFGGMKRSGLGRESGIEAVQEFLETKTVMISTAR